MSKEILKMQNITKIYGNGFVANKDISFTVKEKEIHALVGENGAGKTTLMKILFGMEQPQSGHIYIDGKLVSFANSIEAIAAGIGMVHQHFMLSDSLTVAENVVLGMEPLNGLVVDKKAAEKLTQQISDKYNLKVNATSKVKDLSVGQKQKVEIIKALARDAKILVLDEPTAVLTPQETEELFQQIKVLRENGRSIIFISHKLDEVVSLCDWVTVLRRGEVVASVSIEGLSQQKISRLMVGRDIVTTINKEKPVLKNRVLQMENVTSVNDEGKKVLDNVSLSVYQGEVVGIAGIEGNGQSEIANVITGMCEYQFGKITVNGVDIKDKSIKEIRNIGVSHISEDRLIYGSAADLSIKENLIIDRVDKSEFKTGPFISDKKVNKFVDECIKYFEIACDDRNEPIRMLSGGNMQKVIVAREFTSNSSLIVANQPTRGVDIGTCDMIRREMIRKTREENVAAILISADLNEVIEASDRLIVMYNGQIVAYFSDSSSINEQQLGEYMLGLKKMSDDQISEVY